MENGIFILEDVKGEFKMLEENVQESSTENVPASSTLAQVSESR